MTKLAGNSVLHIKQSLPAFGKITEQSPPLDWLESYLSLYKLPIPTSALDFYCGAIEVNQQSIFTAAWEPSRAEGTAIIVHGYLDNLGLFGHLIDYLLAQNLTVVCFDLPGLGLSAGESAFIDDFSDYTSVLDAILSLCNQQFTAPFYGFGQSTGGAILLKHLLDNESAGDYPFHSLNLLAPLLHPKGWWLNRHFLPFVKPFRKSLKRRFGLSSHDEKFLAFIRQQDVFQPKTMPIPWFIAADKWAREFETCNGSNFAVNVIQGTGDTTLDWKYNLRVFKQKLPNMKVSIIDGAYHHMANEISDIRRHIFNAIDLR
ncbi:MAG: alpha/beta hydrolase [Porticoccaceae bacterium]